MTTLTVAEHGEVVFDEALLEHLGIRHGGTLSLKLLPGGRAESSASWDDLRGFLAGKTNGARLTIDELNEAIAEAGAEAAMVGLRR